VQNSQKITPFLWFANQAEEAANFYVGVFKNSRIVSVVRYGTAGQEIHGQKPGTVMTVDFELDGQRFTALNGGPIFKFTEAISFVIHCQSQAEIDHYWEKLTAGGDPQAQQCGWLKDKFGVSWQVNSTEIIELIKDHESAKSQRAMNAVLQMKKLDVAKVRAAYEGR
jgi:predicted 3-demethylubiquinone-9 3-methyltransferase (glyoxalase superfamily)